MKEKDIHTDELGDVNNLPNSLRINPFSTPADFFDKQQKEINNQIRLEKNASPSFNTIDSIPKNYFATLEDNILAKITEIKLKDRIETDGFGLPEHYFEGLESSIQHKIIEEDLKDKITDSGFGVPNDYFSTLENSISLKISEENLRSIISSDGFNTPTLYFDTLEDHIKGNIKVDTFYNQQVGNEFEVPKDYFENLEAKILAKVLSTTNNEENSTPIISLPKRKINWSSYGAAAAILLIGIGTYFSLNMNTGDESIQKTSSTQTTVNLQDISDNELVSYLAQVSEDDELINLTEIVEYRNGEPLSIEPEMKDSDIEEYLNYLL